MNAMTVNDVTKVYGEGHTQVKALCDASLELYDNEFLALLGPSGSGKTTLLSVIGGLLAPTSGTVTIGDTLLTDLSKKDQTKFRANRVGFVFQGFNLVPFLTARENMTVMASISDAGRAPDRATGGPTARRTRTQRPQRQPPRTALRGANVSAWRLDGRW